MLLEQQNKISRFLKDHVTLKSGVMAGIQLYHNNNKLHFKANIKYIFE